MPRGAGCSRGVPARLACLLLLALIAVVCLTTGADARKRPAACTTNPNGTADCNSCVKKNCKFDDRCIFDKSAANSPTSPQAVCQPAATKLNPDVCRGIQRKHGKKAPAIVSATGVAGQSSKRARCLASVAPQNNNTSVPCGCMNKNNKAAKKGCKFCVPSLPIKPCTDGLINGTSTEACPIEPGTDGTTPPGPPPPPPPPPPPGTGFLPGNLMTMQGGAVTYTPSNGLGNWTTLCQIPQQAKAITVGAGQTDISGNTIADTAYILRVWAGTEFVPGLDALYAEKYDCSRPGSDCPTTYDSAVTNQVYNYMSGTTYFENAAKWYVEGLPKTAAGKSTGGIAPSTYTGSGKDYLNSYFRSGIMPTPSTAAPSGSSDQDANGQILMKTSAYWVAVTQVMYNLDMAEKNLAANNTAAAQANFDSAAAAYYGCGDTNPVPLPLYSGAPITYPTPSSTALDTGVNATTMSIYGVANKRADNYGTAGLVSTDGGTCTVASATCKIVASLNVAGGAALTAGPTTANIAEIRDAVLTIFTQAAQRYVAKFTLAAHLPGNGMGGSTNPTTTTSSDMPIEGSYIPVSLGGTLLTKKQPTACGGKSSYVWQGALDAGCGKATQPTDDGGANAKIVAAGTAVTGEFPANDGCRQVSGVNACGVVGSIPLEGSPATNTATFSSIQAEVKSAAAADAPFMMLAAAQVVATAGVGGGNTNLDITAATRGLAAGTALDSNTQPPIACVGKDVVFAEVTTCGVATGNVCTAASATTAKAGIGLKLCNPAGLVPPKAVLDATNYADKEAAYRGDKGAPGYGGTGNDYTGAKPGSAR